MRSITFHRRLLGALTLVAGLALGLPGVASAEQQALKIGFQKGGGLLAVLKSQGVLEKSLGEQGYRVTWHEFQAGPQLLEALNAGSVDFGYTGAPPPIFAQAAGIDLVYVGAEPHAPRTEAIVTHKDSPIADIAGLKGKKVAVQKGSSANYLLVASLAKAGLSFADIQPVYLPPADARAAFENRSVDAWSVWDPYLAAIEKGASVRVLGNYEGLSQTNAFYEASRRFAETNPKLLQALLGELAKAGAWANDNPGEVARLLAPQLGLPEDVLTLWQKRARYGVQPLSAEIVAVQQKVADTFHEQKLIPRSVKVGEIVWKAPQ
ncbi:periplasmic sulfonate-binding protein of ABC transporter [Azotobacter vinelandii CA]|uniref:Putative aliphatic sulfonates-binding protein n=2 Tax=Azotobacter vinelandii TaxID=354 RepID=C1DE36_AZOVD|nr:sulfonate ABC transporter substrate-binding protein [Azotobacter vinelandii]ACO80144.1 periplasmic sulfonate-binding protein of ABC transporter [Azotobacter vinelandii DJ]AGK16095.1 periplasmic sulfonate-binding protein of ABC transporter [Azotobacter vinelandii CA]AGK21730.1 periplasmic sulfonate-binding protein of ABC transporter [Azotobacter vinelandii CA6]SFX20645.1 sulfonate transport system substrate-binding protein [Azotobacter vinelandii]GLK62055.1 sulfonate ABC transporter substrat